MYSFDTTYRVLYADVDQMGFMYYGHYAKLFELGRVESLRNLGISYKEVEAAGIWMPVYELNSRYIAPAKYDEILTVRTVLEEMPKAKIVFKNIILDSQAVELHRATVTLVFLKQDNHRLALCPSLISEKLKPYF